MKLLRANPSLIHLIMDPFRFLSAVTMTLVPDLNASADYWQTNFKRSYGTAEYSNAGFTDRNNDGIDDFSGMVRYRPSDTRDVQWSTEEGSRNLNSARRLDSGDSGAPGIARISHADINGDGIVDTIFATSIFTREPTWGDSQLHESVVSASGRRFAAAALTFQFRGRNYQTKFKLKTGELA